MPKANNNEIENAFAYEDFLSVSNGQPTIIFKVPKPSYERLRDRVWFNDDLINYGLSVTYERFLSTANRNLRVMIFSTFFYKQYKLVGFEGVQRWTRKRTPFDCDLVVFPCNDSNHWFTISISNPAGMLSDAKSPMAIIGLDSLAYDRNIIRSEILTWVQREASNRNLEYQVETPLMSLALPCAEQPNDYDCGPYMIHNLDRFLRHHSQFRRSLEIGADLVSVMKSKTIWRPDMAKKMRLYLREHADRAVRNGGLV
ncbi:hypothetical protein M422DRAFT_28282 [Sphaerobolus stellatus SS14]|nr:hypothetical protein M422DRAFT_28282 [Sphaerobolus stellatus SS14]